MKVGTQQSSPLVLPPFFVFFSPFLAFQGDTPFTSLLFVALYSLTNLSQSLHHDHPPHYPISSRTPTTDYRNASNETHTHSPIPLLSVPNSLRKLYTIPSTTTLAEHKPLQTNTTHRGNEFWTANALSALIGTVSGAGGYHLLAGSTNTPEKLSPQIVGVDAHYAELQKRLEEFTTEQSQIRKIPERARTDDQKSRLCFEFNSLDAIFLPSFDPEQRSNLRSLAQPVKGTSSKVLTYLTNTKKHWFFSIS